MKKRKRNKLIPDRIGNLILHFLHDKLDNEEGKELDEWVTASDENMEIFEKLTDVDRINFIYKHVYRDESGSWIIIDDERIPFKG
jgi:hypothetical protein